LFEIGKYFLNLDGYAVLRNSYIADYILGGAKHWPMPVPEWAVW